MHTPAPLARRAVRQTVFYTALFSLLAHGYRFLNMTFSGDAVQISQAEEVAYQISIGRFLQPVLWQIRGTITAPLTIGLFSTAALIGAALLIVSLLDLREHLPIALTCGVLATNETLAVSYATYLPWMDVYMVALLFAVAGVYVSRRWKNGWLLSPLFYLVTLGLYQSYMQAAVSLVIVLLILDLIAGERPAAIWLEGLRACVSLLAALVLYAVAFKAITGVMGLEARNDYNGIAEVGVMSLSDVPDLLAQTYLYPIQFFLRGADHAFIPPALTLALLALGLIALLVSARRLKAAGWLTLLFLLAVWPLGANFVTFISKGTVHPLMVYSFFLLYVLCIVLLSRTCAKETSVLSGILSLGRRAGALLVAVMLVQNILTANQLYLRRDLEFYATTSAFTRILKRADSVEGYVPGETPVCVLGYLPASKIGFVRPGFETLSNLQGMRYTYAAAYETSTVWYAQMVLGYPVNFVSEAEQKALSGTGIQYNMPSYPEEGYCQMIDGILFIRLN